MAAGEWLPYGTQRVQFATPSGWRLQRVEPRVPARRASAAEILEAALAAPIGSRPLRDIARGRRSAAILIPGKARRVGTQEYVPRLLAELNAGGIADDAIDIFLADGTHDQHLERDITELIGRDVIQRVRCVGHACDDRDSVVRLGTTSAGTPVLLNRRVCAADLKIVTGRIVPHYFAGYTGGRKTLIPGVAGFETIVANHRLTLDGTRGIHPAARPCNLDDNPVHLDMLEAARMAPPDFCLNTLLDAEHRIMAAVAGDFEAAHAEGVRLAQALLHVTLDAPVDAAIVSAGGVPYDCNFMQALKAPFNTQSIIRRGGALLWLAECRGGIQPQFLQWASIASDDELRRAVAARYALTGHNSIMLRDLIRRVDAALYSALPSAAVRSLGLHPVASVADGVRWLAERRPAAMTCAIVPHASSMHASLTGRPRGAQ
jgi:lactate racemase